MDLVEVEKKVKLLLYAERSMGEEKKRQTLTSHWWLSGKAVGLAVTIRITTRYIMNISSYLNT